MRPARLNHDPGRGAYSTPRGRSAASTFAAAPVHTGSSRSAVVSWTSSCGCLQASVVAAVEWPPSSAMTFMCAPFELSSET
jgi:hypothetical protein